MQLISQSFFLFFAAVLAVYWVMPRKGRAFWLLGASYLCCGLFSVQTLVFVLYSTLTSWAVGLALDRAVRYRRLLLTLGLAANLGVLFWFKYAGFFLRNLNLLLLHTVQTQPLDILSDLVVPVGLSFYTFQVAGYLIDVYRRKSPAEGNLLRYALFVAFFPKLVQGPIERSDHLLVQLRSLETLPAWDYDRLVAALTDIVWGLFQKMVLADRLGVFVNAVFGYVDACGTIELTYAAVAYALQIYLDFNGYTCIALGIARAFGLRLMDNFRAPFLATSTADLWRRWHISLSSWFRDYLYIPLGGNRVSRFRHYLNIFVTMLVSGLWHGASWNFLAWGGLNGLYQVAGAITLPLRRTLYARWGVRTHTFGFRLGQRLCTFALFAFSVIFFRAPGLQAALHYLYRLFTRWNPWVLFEGGLYAEDVWTAPEQWVLMLGLVLVFAVMWLRESRGLALSDWLAGQVLPFRWAVCLGLVLTVIIFGEYGVAFDSTQFLYFNF